MKDTPLIIDLAAFCSANFCFKSVESFFNKSVMKASWQFHISSVSLYSWIIFSSANMRTIVSSPLFTGCSSMYSQARNRPPPAINFLTIFHPGHSYSNPSFNKLWKFFTQNICFFLRKRFNFILIVHDSIMASNDSHKPREFLFPEDVPLNLNLILNTYFFLLRP